MIQINLLPVRTRKKRDGSRQFLALYILSVLVTVGVIGYFWYEQNREIEGLNGRLAKVQQEVQRYSQYEAMLKDLTKKKEVMEKKKDVIKNLQKDRDTLARMFALLSVEVPPERMWFERFSQSGNGIALDGVALNNESIADFMRNLESSPYVEKGSVSLSHSRQIQSGNMKLREFQINYRFVPFSEVEKQLKAKKS